MKTLFAAISMSLFGFLMGCASTAVTPLAQNEILVSTSAAPACGTSGAARVASQMAAVETIRSGFERYIILGAQAENNVRAVSTGPTFATTTGTFNTIGNTTFGSSTTTFGGSQTVLTGSNDTRVKTH